MSNLDFGESDRKALFDYEKAPIATWYFPNYQQFDIAALEEAGIEHVLLDLDGNLTPAYHHDKVTPETIMAILAMKEVFRTVSIASNNEWDLTPISSRFGFDHVFQPYQPGTDLPYKPDPSFFAHTLETLSSTPQKVVMIGDDPVHDVLGASDLGIQTVLVDRLDPYNFF